MARAFWKGSISFGLVEIPVSLRPALQSDDLSFTLLNRKDFAPVGYKRYDKNTGREVPWDQIVRGYEYEPDEYVVLTDEELKQASPKKTQSIEIVEFVDGSEIDPLYYDTPYYVEPQKKASKSYALLREALNKSGKVGIAQVVLRTRQHIAALLVRSGALVLNLLRYPHELRSIDQLDVPDKKSAKGATAAEVRMAEQLIDGMTGRWDPDKFKDEYRDDIMALVRKKVRSNQTHTILEPEPGEKPAAPRKEVVDLMPLLKRSLESHTGGGSRRPAARKSPATRTASRGTAGAARASRQGRDAGTQGTKSRQPARSKRKSA
ncbi:MAG TPA: Ku protein [Candidatus Eisenbacteria bacterium]|jgi:DNA end-binding protein Ku|nr:Ku protein [Candidatus Eisenbacteria bacterium]